MRGFFSAGRGERLTLAFLVAFSAFSFLPLWRDLHFGGMAVFGWLMAALMVISPALAFIVFWRKRGRS